LFDKPDLNGAINHQLVVKLTEVLLGLAEGAPADA
jgi:hypothetical protein